MMFFKTKQIRAIGENVNDKQIKRLQDVLQRADAVVIGAGLSTSAGFTYAGERFLSLSDAGGLRAVSVHCAMPSGNL
ncbi:MAG: hypothetical protein NC231_07480 [Bacillus sp. (in: Bacteria)]|nr:hypothetical protein [Bacillus sp. (in: firmicutes)]